MPYISIQLVVEDTGILKSYDPPATNHYVKVFQPGIDSPEEAWYAIYTKRDNISYWVADCCSLAIARICAKALGDKYGFFVDEEFPAEYSIKTVERPLTS